MKELFLRLGRVSQLVSSERRQFLAYAGLSLGASGLAAMLYFSDQLAFHRLIGTLNPFAVMVPIIFLGFIMFLVSLRRKGLAILKKGTLQGVLLSAGLAMILGVIGIATDYWIVYPKTMNVPFPESLAYYPSVAFLAEIVFHVAPATLLSLLLSRVFRNLDGRRAVWIAILIASLADPAFQILDAAANHYASWAVLVVGLHVFVVNLGMLMIFRRYDFVSVVSFRLFYYIIWHIVWGSIRLHVLF